MHRNTDTVVSWMVFAVLGWSVARLLDRPRPSRDAILVATTAAVINWIGYERPAVLQDENRAGPRERLHESPITEGLQ